MWYIKQAEIVVFFQIREQQHILSMFYGPCYHEGHEQGPGPWPMAKYFDKPQTLSRPWPSIALGYRAYSRSHMFTALTAIMHAGTHHSKWAVTLLDLPAAVCETVTWRYRSNMRCVVRHNGYERLQPYQWYALFYVRIFDNVRYDVKVYSVCV